MLKQLHPRSAYDVLALLAFFIAVGTGGAYAANTVYSTDIVDGQVKNADLASSSVTSAKLYDGSVLNADLASSSVTSAKLYNGSVLNADLGLNSVTSDRVATNALTGADIDESTLSGVKISGLTRTFSDSADDSTSPKAALADCPAGTKAVGVGYAITGATTGSSPNQLAGVIADEVWNFGSYVRVIAYEIAPTAADWRISVQATCVDAE